MRVLEPLEIGLMVWAGDSSEATIREVQSFGLSAAQLGIAGDTALVSGRWIANDEVLFVTAVCSYLGESYADIPTVHRTVGFVAMGTREERLVRTKDVSDFAAALKIPSVACHIGAFTQDRAAMILVIRDICDHCAGNGQSFALETGQESAHVLLQFIEDVNRPNLKINFDPANLILYGTGDPLQAFDQLAPHVVSVHCKDGNPPPADKPDALGAECRLGDGSVNVPRFIGKLQECGYRGILSIEREESDRARRAADIRDAGDLLERLKL